MNRLLFFGHRARREGIRRERSIVKGGAKNTVECNPIVLLIAGHCGAIPLRTFTHGRRDDHDSPNQEWGKRISFLLRPYLRVYPGGVHKDKLCVIIRLY